ncbi:MAG: hypothetical protein JJE04_06555 [Acidobacteriia bacterium]|nr:hypothetical protein [Terriglobia bacterium]
MCDRPMSPHTIRYRNVLYRYYRCRSSRRPGAVWSPGFGAGD